MIKSKYLIYYTNLSSPNKCVNNDKILMQNFQRLETKENLEAQKLNQIHLTRFTRTKMKIFPDHIKLERIKLIFFMSKY